jgi:hypothetical protein
MEVTEAITPARPTSSSRYSFFAVIVLALTCSVLLLANRKLQEQNTVLAKQFRALSASEEPPVGSTIPALHGTSISGKTSVLNLTQRNHGTLLLILSPTCPHCLANFHNWKELMPLIAAENVVLVDLTSTADAAYMAAIAMPADSQMIRIGTQERSLYNLSATPTTIWLDAHGVVKHVWAGELQDDQLKQLRQDLASPNA